MNSPKNFSQLLRNTISLSLLIFATIHCGPSTISSGIQSQNSERFSAEPIEGGAITPVSFNSGNQATIRFNNVSTTSKFTVALFTYDEDGSTQSYGLSSLNEPIDEDLIQELAALSQDEEELNTNEALFSESDITSDFHHKLMLALTKLASPK